MLFMVVMLCTMTYAQFTTKGDGKTYSIKTLAEMEGTGIEEYPGTQGYPPSYLLSTSITIAEGDKFVMDDRICVSFAPNVILAVEGEADFRLTQRSLFTSAIDSTPLGAAVRITGATTTTFENCIFSIVGLELMGKGATHVNHCSFMNHDGSSAAALYFISAGAASTIEDCHFEYCKKAAIGSAANASQPLTIKNCTLVRNSLANNNIPQINITAANKLTIDGCTIEGNPKNNMVGGIGISNFYSFDADVTISGCTIQDNRYGIGLVGPAAQFVVSDCTLHNNKYETNAMNGGSGISLYDPYQKTCAWLAGNRIEGNLWGVTIIGCQEVCLGNLSGTTERERGGNIFKDNGNGGALYDLYNNSTLTVYAQNNTWNVSDQTQEQIESVIFHKADDASLGEVIFWPAANMTCIRSIEQSSGNKEPYYSINGIRRSSPVKGLNIIRGKKVVH